MIYEDDEVELTEEEIEELYNSALTAVLTNEDVGWVHVPVSQNNTLALCGRTGESAIYFSRVYDLSSSDVCDTCSTLKAMES